MKKYIVITLILLAIVIILLSVYCFEKSKSKDIHVIEYKTKAILLLISGVGYLYFLIYAFLNDKVFNEFHGLLFLTTIILGKLAYTILYRYLMNKENKRVA